MVARNRKVGKRWNYLWPQTRAKVNELEALAKANGLDVMFFDGWRDPAETLKNIQKGTSKVKDAYSSKHTWGAAFDMVFVNAVGMPSWPDKTDPRWHQLGALGESIGLQWGGRWKFFDGPHFQLPFSLTAARAAHGNDYRGYLLTKGVEVV